MEDDLELKLINARKMAELRKKAELANAKKETKPETQKSSKEVLLERLYDRGDEVLETAYSYYPNETATIVEQLATYLRKRGGTEKLSGGELYELFRSVGLRFSLNTTIKVQVKGKFVDLKDTLKLRKEEEIE